MKKVLLTGLLIILIFNLFGQNTNTNNQSSTASKYEWDFLWISGGIGAGGVVSTTIVNSGIVLPASLDFFLQRKHHRVGFGVTSELYLTPENLGKMIFSDNNSNVRKYYFMYDWMLLGNFPVNIGGGLQVGGFYVGKEKVDNVSDKTRLFVNFGVVAEVGIRPVYIYARPAIEYKSYNEGSFHKEIMAVAQVGIRLKLMTEEEKAQRGKN
ncbi:MAG: hypothetical protein A2W91_01980 [Bacteroidetes bacterium GWF2_38_335]|nr:MAG: hypothetical protein A2W91_01980 [Bacteroidetes bacterium GWF2_38_335]OFY80622.1 MAG: hypothetical protein A2281_04995 [Bacteroidetes bacterium RIFOXYA12_FULL_38_20]HBS86962.1 hypothetical protein [Bacteroidales bacterium]